MKKALIFVMALILLVGVFAACGPKAPATTTGNKPVVTTAPKATDPKTTEPKTTEPKATEPGTTVPPVTEPGTTVPPVTEPTQEELSKEIEDKDPTPGANDEPVIELPTDNF